MKTRGKKVCIIAKSSFRIDTRLRQQVNTLSSHCIPIDLLCMEAGNQEKHKKKKYVRIYEVINKTMGKKDSFKDYLSSTAIFMANAFIRLASLSFRNEYKVIVVHTLPEFMVFITIFHKIFGSKIIMDARDVTVELLSSRWRKKGVSPVRTIAVYIEKFSLALCDHVITASNGFKKCLVGRGMPEKKVTVLVNTADESIFEFIENRNLSPITKGARFIYHGTVAQRFGTMVAVQAMARIKERIPGSTLSIYGFYDPNYLERLKSFIKENGLQNSVLFYKDEDLSSIYAKIKEMDLGIVPYLSDDFMNLALSTKTFEYAASGLPVVASNLRSGLEVFDDSCIQYCTPGNASELAEKITEMCLNGKLRESKRKNAYRRFKEKYTSKSQGTAYLKLILNLTGIKDEVIGECTE